MKEIKQIRLFQGLTQKELASMTGISQTYLSQIEHEIKSPTVKMLRRIAKQLGCDLIIKFEEKS
jgi:transcriptional regulator with XRE-family HTH domain